MNVNEYKEKKHSKNKYPLKQMMVPVYPQPPMLYQNQIIAQPQPVYQMISQPYQMVQPLPQASPNPIVAVPVGPPVMVVKPVGHPVLMAQPVVAPQAFVQTIQKPQKKKTQKIIIKKHKPQEDECCNIY